MVTARPARVVVAVATLCAAGLLWAAPRPNVDVQLQRLAQQLEEREAALRDLARQEKSVTRALGELDETLAAMDAQARELDVQAKRPSSRWSRVRRRPRA